MTYSTGLPSTDGSWVALNTGFKTSGPSARRTPACGPVENSLPGARISRSSSHSGTMRSRASGISLEGSSVSETLSRVTRSSRPLTGSHRAGDTSR